MIDLSVKPAKSIQELNEWAMDRCVAVHLGSEKNIAIMPDNPLTTPLPIAYPYVTVDGEFDEFIWENTGIQEALQKIKIWLKIYTLPLNGEIHLIIDVCDEWLTRHRNLFAQPGQPRIHKSPGSDDESSTPDQVSLSSLVQALSCFCRKGVPTPGHGNQIKIPLPPLKGGIKKGGITND